jgi:DNA (cytosine-5)-methyltransferase 1
MTHGSLFSGIGGFDLAAEWMGWENKFHCEWNEFGQKVLKYYWPNAESFHDITKTDFTKYANRIDILTGGFPCQPYSMAGKRKGKDDERHLWPEMLRCIREVKPKWVIGENVLGLVNWSEGLVFHEVQADLEAEGYEVFPYVLPAVSVNAPHRRDRVWFVAHSKNNGWNGGECEQWKGIETDQRQFCECEAKGRNEIWPQFKRHCQTSNVTNSKCFRLEHCTDTGKVSGKERNAKGQRNKSSLFFEANVNGHKSNWQNFPTVSPICDGNDGFSDRLDSITFSKWRKESIKAGGNAIVPQVAFQIFKTIKQFEQLNKQA